MSVERIPAELRDRPQWVVFRNEKRDGKLTKVPYVARPPRNRGADGTQKRWPASSTDPATWRTYLEAVEVSKDDFWDGIGFVFSRDDPYVGVDLDELNADAGAIMLKLDSYAERSISGRGAHVIVKASLNGHPRNRSGPLEIYDQGRYFVMTGEHIAGTPDTIEQRQAELEEVLAFFLPAPEPEEHAHPARPVDLDDRELLDKAMRAKNGTDFERLWSGDPTGYPSPSEADLALCSLLAFWTGRDPDRIDRLFRASALMRPKWERADYRARTIDAAITGCSEAYSPSDSKAGITSGNTPDSVFPASLGSGAGASDSVIPLRSRESLAPESLRPAETTGPCVFSFATAEQFAAEKEDSAEILLGDGESGAAMVAGGTGITFGDGGAGKTTLELDRAMHLATGTPWLGMPVRRPLKVLIVENDGPRGPLRAKVEAKLTGWQGPPLKGRLHFLTEPWGEVNIGRESHREALAEYIRERDIDVLLAGPIVSLGMVGGGTPEEVAAFEAHLRGLRALLDDRPLVVWLIHHENTRGQISGAWTRVPDTLVHVTATGNGHTRLFWKKARWSSMLHGATWKLNWADGESFELDETPETTDEEIAEALLSAVRADPGKSWRTYKSVIGNAEKKMIVRDRLIVDGKLVNRGKGKAFALWVADDPSTPPADQEPLL